MNNDKHQPIDPDESITAVESGFESIVSPFQEFISSQKTSSTLLIACALSALVIANTDIANQYEHFLDTYLGIFFCTHTLEMTLHH